MNKRQLVKKTLTEMDALEYAIECNLINLDGFRCASCSTGIMNIEKGKIRKGIDMRFRCNNRSCRKTESIYIGTIFHGMHIMLSQWFDLLYAFCEKKTQKETMAEALVAQKTVHDWFKRFDNIIAHHTTNFLEPIGGLGYTVEIDECHLFTRKYHVGRVLVSESFWVVGCICRETKEIRMVLTDCRNRNVLHGFIRSNIRQESRLISDKWAAYNTINHHNYMHDSVNHTENFVDPEDPSIYTNTIERLWRSLREFLPINLRRVDLELKLKTFVAIYNFGAKTVSEKFEYLIYLIKTSDFYFVPFLEMINIPFLYN